MTMLTRETILPRVEINPVLACKVRATNRLARECNRLHPLFVAALRPFLGKKVQTQSGYSQRLRDAVAHLMPRPGEVQVYPFGHVNSIRWTVKVCELDGQGGCQYREMSLWVGECEGDILVSVREDYEPMRDDHTAEEVLANRERFKVAEAAYQAARSALGDFGEYDRN
jgi:hypothetical protein